MSKFEETLKFIAAVVVLFLAGSTMMFIAGIVLLIKALFR